MEIELWWLIAVAIGYLVVLFLIAYVADSGLLPRGLLTHSWIYSLSLGVYATSWTYYGSVGLADRSGFVFLTIYLGVTGAFLLGPYILRPILRLSRDYQLTSIADLLAFRYGGRGTGLIVTLFMLVGILPYISLQIRAVTESASVLSQAAPPNLLALTFCALIIVFAILFGARHLTPREKHHGLVVAIAFESAVKLVALLVAGVFAVNVAFDSPAGLQRWIGENPDTLRQLYASTRTAQWPTLMLLAFCAAFLLPRQYHMTFVENENPRHLNAAYWQFPLYLLLLNLPIVPILLAGRVLSLDMAPDFYVLGITLSLDSPWLSLLVFMGGLSAASAMMIVTTLSLAYMCLNHLLLPASLGKQPNDFYRRLLWYKRIIIALIIAGGYGFWRIIELNEGLASLGLISFVAAAQLLPGVIGLLFWSRATQFGLLLGLSGGAIVWFALLILPLLQTSVLPTRLLAVDTDIWSLSTFCTLSVNATLFVIGSLLTRPSAEETQAGQAVIEQSGLVIGGGTARSVLHFRYALQAVLGNKVAEEELQRALAETGVAANEIRPAELRLLHARLEQNLTGLVGPTLARDILSKHPARGERTDRSPDARLLEISLEASREQMRGMTKQLDDLRRYLRAVLHELPLGVCSIAADGTVYLWNSAMQSMTGITERVARNTPIAHLPPPWDTVLGEFAQSEESHRFRSRVPRDGSHGDIPASINLHKADIVNALTDDSLAGQVILMEDRSNIDTLEAELTHSERLASIGRLAAGVAHEIGNPLTGIASIAQNLQYEAGDDDAQREVLREHAGDILGQVDRINRIVRSLLSFSHADVPGGKPGDSVSIAGCVSEALQLVQLRPECRHLDFDIDIDTDATAIGDANQLTQVFVNLLNNAGDASAPDGTIHVHARSPGAGEEAVTIVIDDHGSGIAPENRERIFEPFFTTKSVGHGTGLGLSLVYNIVSNHSGRIRVDEDYRDGTRIVLTLPSAPSRDADHAAGERIPA